MLTLIVHFLDQTGFSGEAAVGIGSRNDIFVISCAGVNVRLVFVCGACDCAGWDDCFSSMETAGCAGRDEEDGGEDEMIEGALIREIVGFCVRT